MSSYKPSEGSEIADWFAGRSVFVTGGTGFMGKVLVEKLLRSCPGINALYLLVRPKRGVDPVQRIQTILKQPLFDKLRSTNPDALYKVIAIAGDITLPGLNISSSDEDLLVENVSVVFHSAATIKFDEPLRMSVNMNVLGTKRIVELCHKMPKLEALVHVSTAYCNCDQTTVEEILYPPPADPEKIIKCTESLNEEILNEITPRIIRPRPNTYTYTKALAEHVLVESAKDLPAAIVRPSIVSATAFEPVQGWIDNLNGPTGLFVGGGKGVLRSLLCYTNLKADLIPVDIAINMFISIAWYTARAKPNNILIYNCTSGASNPVTWGQIEKWSVSSILKNPSQDVFWYPGGSFKSSRIYHSICNTLFQRFPAYILDLAAIAQSKKPMMIKICDKLQKATETLQFFTTREWCFKNDHAVKLLASLPKQDRKMFNFDMTHLKWNDYIEHYVLGSRQFILKEDPCTLPAARKNLQKMYLLDLLTKMALLTLLWRILLSRFNVTKAIPGNAFKLCFFMFTLCKNSIVSVLHA